MSDIVKAAEAAGLYIESHECVKTAVEVELYCSACGKGLVKVPAGGTMFVQTHGSCTCSWKCCHATKAVKHVRHLEHRTVTASWDKIEGGEEQR